MSVCRHCGPDAGSIETPDAVCDACANSPLCAECGHERAEHSGASAPRTDPRCRATVGDFQSLGLGPCACEGFRPVEGSAVDAAFAQPEPDPFADPPLRLA